MHITAVLTTALILASSGVWAAEPESERFLEWSALPDLPHRQAAQGHFLGVAGDALILAGGLVTDEAGLDRFDDRVFFLTSPDGVWKQASIKLSHPRAGGVSVTWKNSLFCIGGETATGRSTKVVRLRLTDDRVFEDSFPELPESAELCGALVGNTIYVATVNASDQKGFWALDLSIPSSERSWQKLDACPGPVRRDAVAAAQDGAFFLIGGRAVESTSPGREDLLVDAYRFTPAFGWSRVADLPQSASMNLSPAVALGQSHLLLLPKHEHAKDQHQGLLYHTITDTWRPTQGLPARRQVLSSEVSALTRWQDHIVLLRENGGLLWAQPRSASARLHRLDYAVLALYLVGLLGIGFYFSRRENHTEDYFLAGRRVPWWAAGISIFGTSISAVTFMAIPALVYRTDWVYFLGNLMIVAVAPVVVWFYLPMFRRLQITSAYEYLELRFGLSTRLVGSAAFMAFQMGRMGIVVYLPALALASVSGLDVYFCIALMGVVATFYTILGGIEAVIWTDVLQVIVLMGGALISLVLIFRMVPGGLAEISSMAASENKLRMAHFTWDAASAGLWVVVVGNFLKFLIPYSSDQSLIQRYLTTPDQRQAARSIWTNALVSIPAWALFFALGTALWAFYKTRPDLLNPMAHTDEIFPWFIVGQLPVGLAGLVIAALLAAAMSSLDSSMNSMATAFTVDFYRRFRPAVSDKSCLRVARVVTLFLGALGVSIAMIMAYLQTTSAWDQFLKFMGLFGGGLGGLFLAGLFTKRTSGRGILVGFITSAVVLYLVQASDTIHFFLYGGIGMTTCAAVGYLASWILPENRNLEGLTIYQCETAEP